MNTKDMVLEELAEGTEEAVIAEVSDVVLEIAKSLSNDIPFAQMALNNNSGREAAKAGTAVLLYSLIETNMLGSNLPVSKDKLKRALRIVNRNSARNLLAPHLTKIRQELTNVANTVSSLPEPEKEKEEN